MTFLLFSFGFCVITLGRPIGRSISGLNIPLFPISVHFLRSGWYPKISMDGSVYGLYAGLKRIFVELFERTEKVNKVKKVETFVFSL